MCLLLFAVDFVGSVGLNARVGLETGTLALISGFWDASYDCAMYAMLQKITRLPQSLSCK